MRIYFDDLIRDLERVGHELMYTNTSNIDFRMFTQVWGNTSGGFQGMGGSAMTKQSTIVLIPHVNREGYDKIACVFFGGQFAYKVAVTPEFMDDLSKFQIAGCHDAMLKYRVLEEA